MYSSVGFFTLPLSGGGVGPTAGLGVVAKRFRVYNLYFRPCHAFEYPGASQQQ